MQRVALGLSILLNIWLFTFMILSGPLESQPEPVVTAELAPEPTSADQTNGYNLIWPSEDFAPSRPDGALIQGDANIGPTASKTASRLAEDGNSGRHRVERSVGGLQPNSMHALSLYVKVAERSGIMLEMRDNRQGKYGAVRFDLKKRTLAKTGDIKLAGMQIVDNGWVRCWAAMPFDSDQGVYTIGLLGPPDGAPQYKGDGQSGLLIWGAQLEPAAHPGSYVATVDRAAIP
jgi:hypothetical protein